MKRNTFIKDIHNKEIHVGDTVKIRPYIGKEYIGKVAFHEGTSQYILVDDDGEVVALLSHFNDIEIINKTKGE